MKDQPTMTPAFEPDYYDQLISALKAKQATIETCGTSTGEIH